MLVVFLIDLGIPVQVVQIDNQGRLASLFPGIVQTIVMPVGDESRNNDAADAEALDPVMELILSPGNIVKIIDVGANFDTRFFQCLSGAEVPEECRKIGSRVICMVPMLADGDSIRLAKNTADRFVATFPGETLVPVLCDAGIDFAALPDPVAHRIFETRFRQQFGAEAFLTHPRLLPKALAMLEASRVPATAFNVLDPREIAKITGQKIGVARVVRNDVKIYTSLMFDEFEKILPFRAA